MTTSDRPLVSVFTPTHHPRFLWECYLSLSKQTYDRWEWVILCNGPVDVAHVEAMFEVDSRVQVQCAGDLDDPIGVGAAKRAAIERCQGDILLELDHDDLLAATAIAKVVDAVLATPACGMVYSDFAQVTADLKPDRSTFDLRHGWTYRDETVGGLEVLVCESMPVTPHNLSLIWYAPNHLRAFTREAYDAVGGYNPDLDVLDDQDLMARLYLHGDFVHIPECLYLQRVHRDNTQKIRNDDIQTQTRVMQADTIEQLALAWAEREGLPCLDLGGAHGDSDPRYLRVDQHKGLDVDVVHTFPSKMLDWEQDTTNLPLGFRRFREAGTVGVIRASDFLEHVADKTAMWNELHRLLAPGGILLTHTPSTDGRGAFQDPTHVAFYNSNSFWYVTQESHARYVPESTAKFQLSSIVNHYPGPFEELHDIVYVTANLICLKDGGPRNGGILDW